jgi:hypothetical protein
MTSSLVHTRRILNGYTHILRGSADVLQRPLETSADSSILISRFGCIARRCFHLSHRISTALLAFAGSKLTNRNGFERMPNSIQSSRTNAPSKGAGRGRLYQCCTRPVVSPILRRPGRRNRISGPSTARERASYCHPLPEARPQKLSSSNYLVRNESIRLPQPQRATHAMLTESDVSDVKKCALLAVHHGR